MKKKNEENNKENKMSEDVKIAEPKQKIQVDLEVDTSIKDLGVNPYAKIIHMARAVDAWRIFPRLFLTVYIVLLYKCVIWYMNLQAPTMEQSGLISIVVGAGLLGLVYTQEVNQKENNGIRIIIISRRKCRI
tara:strand:+ start:47 stop:442 length:396 start_codon:yes stop_codon:yes gene_type:complete